MNAYNIDYSRNFEGGLTRRAWMGGALALAGASLLPGAVLARPRVKPELELQVSGLRRSGRLAFVALDPVTGAVVQEQDADLALPPASTLKTVTALYALDRLGAEHRFTTRVLLDGDRLVLAGGGDPALDSDALAVLAKDTAAALTARSARPARLEVWGGALPTIPQIVENMPVYSDYNPALSGMILNYNRVHMGWTPGKNGPAITWTAEAARSAPQARGFELRFVERAVPLFGYDDANGVERWSVSPRALNGKGARWLPVRHPELYAGDIFRTLLRANGVTLPAASIAEAASGDEIARLDSEPVLETLRNMLKYSTNLTSEVLGLTASGAPDLRASAAAMEQWLRDQGVAGPVHFADHSGLSAESRVSARSLAQMLQGVGRQRGLAGLLHEASLEEKGDAPVPGRIMRAKTGTLNFVSNLAGYAENGPRGVVFAILTDDPARHRASYGQELPGGVKGWTARSKAIQRGLIRRWLDGEIMMNDPYVDSGF